MINSPNDYKKFLEDNRSDDLFLYLVLTDDRDHPYTQPPSLLFVKNVNTKNTYCFSINHQDAPKVVEWEKLVSDINTLLGRKFVIDKKVLLQHGKFTGNILDINLALYLNNEKFINFIESETSAHKFIRQNFYTYVLHNKIVPLVKHKEMVESIFSLIYKFINLINFSDKSYLKINDEILPTLAEIETNGIFVNEECFRKYFDSKVHGGLVFSQYNIFTSTGRPSNRFGGVNYAALNKDDGTRKCFVSRFGEEGMMVLIDYSAFHHRILCELLEFNLDIDIDFYEYLAKLLFNKKDVDQQDKSDAKKLSWKQLYGGVDDEYSHVQYFYSLKKYINSYWNKFEQDGFITTPLFGRKFTKGQITDPNPPKVLNYILQSTETEIGVPTLNRVNKLLRDKKSKAVLYTYDSILFDVYNKELDFIKNDVVSVMKDNGRFPVKIYAGKSYADVEQISL